MVSFVQAMDNGHTSEMLTLAQKMGLHFDMLPDGSWNVNFLDALKKMLHILFDVRCGLSGCTQNAKRVHGEMKCQVSTVRC